MKTFASFFLFIAIASFTVSCNNDDDSSDTNPLPEDIIPTITLLKIKNIGANSVMADVIIEGDLDPQKVTSAGLTLAPEYNGVETNIHGSGVYEFKYDIGYTPNNNPPGLHHDTTYSIMAYIQYNGVTYYSEPKTFHTCGFTGESGGIVFFDKGEFTDGWRYKEVVQNEDVISLSESTITWGAGCNGQVIGANQEGYENTALIVANCGENTLAKFCDDAVIYGKDDWFLPSVEELKYIFQARGGGYIGGASFTGAYFATSTEFSGTQWSLYFLNRHVLPTIYSQTKTSTINGDWICFSRRY